MSKYFPHAIENTLHRESHSFQTQQCLTLLNGDRNEVGHWVLVRGELDRDPPRVACIQEIVQELRSEAAAKRQPSAVLLKLSIVAHTPNRYNMPLVSASDQWILMPLEVMYTVTLKHSGY